jgi:hypothetical protein
MSTLSLVVAVAVQAVAAQMAQSASAVVAAVGEDSPAKPWLLVGWLLPLLW